MTCLTHHLACDCREKEMRELLEYILEMFNYYKDKDGYNPGYKDWCKRAKKLLGEKAEV